MSNKSKPQALTGYVMFNDLELRDLGITRGALFDIDQDTPVDTDSLFFLPGPVDEMEQALKSSGGPIYVRDDICIPKKNSDDETFHAYCDDMMYDAYSLQKFYAAHSEETQT